MDEQLRLKDDTFLYLKQERHAMQQRIKELKSENEELKSQLSPAIKVKAEGSYYDIVYKHIATCTIILGFI